MEYLRPARWSLPKTVHLAISLAQRSLQPAGQPAAPGLPPLVPPGSAGVSFPSQPGAQRGGMALALPRPAGRQMADRLETLYRRVELSTRSIAFGAEPPAPGASVSLSLALPVPMITRQAPAQGVPGEPDVQTASPAAASPPRAQAQAAEALRRAAHRQEERPAASLPPAELRQVTEQVIKEIDRRIHANRERFGRI
jgi:hypothetical protein